MIFLVDASVLITANALYYPINRVPEFWDWLLHHAEAGRLKIPLEIYEEVKDGPDGDEDHLFAWISDEDVRRQLVLGEEIDASIVSEVVSTGYAPDLNDSEIEQIGRDPFLIAYAIADARNRTVITAEVSKPGKTRQNRRVPDVCRDLGVQCADTFSLVRSLDFSTSWRR